LKEYIDGKGQNHYRDWIAGLDANIRARVIKTILRMGDGNHSGVKPEGEGVSALRIDFGPGYRVYFGQDGALLVILLAGGTKRRQDKDIQLARALWAEYKKRKKEEK
jgi:putative addiction module killer protein